MNQVSKNNKASHTWLATKNHSPLPANHHSPKSHHVCISLMAMLLLLPATASAQLYFGLRGGATIPKSYYADSRMSDNEWMFTEGHQHKGGAGRGWDAGIEIAYAMPFHKNLEILLTADFMQGGVSRNVRDYYELSYIHRYDHCAKYEMQLPRFRNIPILLGCRYAYPATHGIDLYGEASVGFNLRYITDWNLSFASPDWVQTDGQQFSEYNNTDIRHYAPATTFAYRLGAGFIFKKIVILGANFSILGSSPLVWDRTTTTQYSIYGDIVENTNTSHVEYHPLNPTLITISATLRLPITGGGRHVQDW